MTTTCSRSAKTFVPSKLLHLLKSDTSQSPTTRRITACYVTHNMLL